MSDWGTEISLSLRRFKLSTVGLETDAAEIHFWLVPSRIQQSNSSLCNSNQLCISGWTQNSTKRNTYLWPEISQVFRSIIEFTLDVKLVRSIAMHIYSLPILLITYMLFISLDNSSKFI